MAGADLHNAPGGPTVWRRRRCRIKSCSYLSHATRKKRRGDDSTINQSTNNLCLNNDNNTITPSSEMPMGMHQTTSRKLRLANPRVQVPPLSRSEGGAKERSDFRGGCPAWHGTIPLDSTGESRATTKSPLHRRERARVRVNGDKRAGMPPHPPPAR